MRLYKVVILTNLAFGLGLLSGYLWWERDVDRLRREVTAAKQTTVQPAGERSWPVRGIVRGVSSHNNRIFITHEAIPGLMGSMTMGFPLEDPRLSQGLTAGDRIQFTLKETRQRVVAGIRKEDSR